MHYHKGWCANVQLPPFRSCNITWCCHQSHTQTHTQILSPQRHRKCRGYPTINHNQISALLWLCWGWRMKLINKSGCCNKSRARSVKVALQSLLLRSPTVLIPRLTHVPNTWVVCYPLSHSISVHWGNHLFMTNAKNLLVLNVFSIKIIKIISALITLLDKSIICCRFWLFAIRKSDLHAQMNIKLLESIELRYYTQ